MSPRSGTFSTFTNSSFLNTPPKTTVEGVPFAAGGAEEIPEATEEEAATAE